MKILLLIATLFTFTFANAPKAVEHVSAEALKGTWYEMARTYNSYEEGCVNPFIEYELIDQKELKVFNRCYEKDGVLREYKGKVKPITGDSFAQLTKTYFYIFSSEYRIIYIGENKETMIMTDEAIEHLWIMHRKPTLSKEELDKLIGYLAKHMDTSKLIINSQGAIQ